MSVTRVLPAALNPDDELATLDRQAIGRRIKRLRLDRGWTQSDLQDATGAVRTTIAHWERGFWTPSATAFVRLADAFGCRLDYLIRGRS